MLSASETVTKPGLTFGQWLGSKIFPKLGVNEFADLAGVSPSAVSSWLNHGAIPYRRTCYAIASALSFAGIEVSKEEVLAAAGYLVPSPVEEPKPEPRMPTVQFFNAETLSADDARRIVAAMQAEWERIQAEKAHSEPAE